MRGMRIATVGALAAGIALGTVLASRTPGAAPPHTAAIGSAPRLPAPPVPIPPATASDSVAPRSSSALPPASPPTAASGSAPVPVGILVPSCGGYQLCAVPGYPGVYSTPDTVYDPQLGRAAVIPPRDLATRSYLCFEERGC